MLAETDHEWKRARSQIIPGGIATPAAAPAPDSKEVADHPWRDSNLCGFLGDIVHQIVADHPWRDSNRTPRPASCRSSPGRRSSLEG